MAMLAITLQFFIGALLVITATGKSRDMQRFIEIVRAYKVLPQALAKPAAYGIAVGEMLAGLGLLLPWGRDIAALAGSLLLLSFAFAIGVNLLRGRTAISCGCNWGSDSGMSIAAWMVFRNMLLTVLLAGSVMVEPVPGWDLLSGFSVLAAVLSLLLLDFSLPELLVSRRVRLAGLLADDHAVSHSAGVDQTGVRSYP